VLLRLRARHRTRPPLLLLLLLLRLLLLPQALANGRRCCSSCQR
jgi:hypothetical protein